MSFLLVDFLLHPIDGGLEEYDPDGGEIEEYTLEGDVVIDPEYMDEE